MIKKEIRRAKKRSYGLILIASLLFACFVLPRFLNIHLYSVQTGSMEPAYKVGDLLYAVPTAFEKIKAKDVITFKAQGGVMVTHRVMEINYQDGLLFTKGDANNIEDGYPVEYRNVIGVVRFSIPKVGSFLTLLSSFKVKLTIITFALGFLVFHSIHERSRLNEGAKI